MIKVRPLGIVVVTALALLFCGCSENSDPPAVQDINLDDGSIEPGEVELVNVTLNISASDSNSSDRISDPFSLLVVAPVGATYIPGGSVFPIQGQREADSIGTCPDGRTYLIYNFATGEIQNPFNFEEFTDALQIAFRLALIADDQPVFADVSETGFGDPCLPFDGSSVDLNVND